MLLDNLDNLLSFSIALLQNVTAWVFYWISYSFTWIRFKFDFFLWFNVINLWFNINFICFSSKDCLFKNEWFNSQIFFQFYLRQIYDVVLSKLKSLEIFTCTYTFSMSLISTTCACWSMCREIRVCKDFKQVFSERVKRGLKKKFTYRKSID